MDSIGTSGTKYYKQPANVPNVDFQALKGQGEARTLALKQLDRAFKTYGFVYISNHPISEQLVDEAFNWVSGQRNLKLEILSFYPTLSKADASLHIVAEIFQPSSGCESPRGPPAQR